MKKNSAFLVPLLLIACLFIPNIAGQDQLQAPSWELGWETDMGGTYDLMMNEEGDIADVVEFYIENQRMTEINVDITVDWDESENIPIKLDYDESVVVAASDTIILAITISDDSGYSYQRSPSDAMTLKITASEAAFEQSVSEQEIEGEFTVPSVFDMTIESKSKGEQLYAGSSIEYDLIVSNDGNSQDVIKEPTFSVKSCPYLEVQGLATLEDMAIENKSSKDFTIRLVASDTHPERSCEVTISVKSAGNNDITSTMFSVPVSSNSDDTAEQDTNPDVSVEEDDKASVTESDSLPGFLLIETLIILAFASLVCQNKIVKK